MRVLHFLKKIFSYNLINVTRNFKRKIFLTRKSRFILKINTFIFFKIQRFTIGIKNRITYNKGGNLFCIKQIFVYKALFLKIYNYDIKKKKKRNSRYALIE